MTIFDRTEAIQLLKEQKPITLEEAKAQIKWFKENGNKSENKKKPKENIQQDESTNK